MSYLNGELSIPEIIKDIDCLQETQQHSIVIDHNWCINDICNLIKSKKPGEKIESEQFAFSKNLDLFIHKFQLLNNAAKHELNKSDQAIGDGKISKTKSLSSNNVNCNRCVKKNISCKCNSISSSKIYNSSSSCSNLERPLDSSVFMHSEMICAYFLNNSLWRLEINRSLTDLSYVSVSVLMLNNLTPFLNKSVSNIDKNLIFLCQNCEKLNLCTQLRLKLKFYLFNHDLNEIFNKQTIETTIDLKKFLGSLAFCLFKQTNNKNRPKLIEKFTLDKFCQINELLKWLNNRNSDDFCLLTEFQIYSETERTPSESNSNVKNRITKKLKNNFQPKTDSNMISINNTETKLVDSLLSLNYKHAWTIKNWKNFLMPGSTSHTFMSDIDISNIFSNEQVVLEQAKDKCPEQLNESIKFGKFRSKLFNLYSTNANLTNAHNHKDQFIDDISLKNFNKSKIESLLRDVKWKLQLYPNGYNKEFEQNISLFVNFSQITGDLAQFSPSNSIKKSFSSSSLLSKPTNNKTPSAHTFSKTIEETFYDSNDDMGLILLIKSPSASFYSLKECVQEDEEIEFDLLDINSIPELDLRKSRKKPKNSNQLYEIFVKASFQISILDSNGHKVDKSQSEKQLFELNGSWGYKEYMSVHDLLNFKEKYLTNNCNDLSLNCKIILFYTITEKTNLSESILTPPIILKSEQYSICDNNFYLNTNENCTRFEIDRACRSKPKKANKNPLKECNTLLYDLKRLFNQSEMYDLIVQAPKHLNSEISSIDKFKQFKVHKLILSVRSEVFEKMFNIRNQNSFEITNPNNILTIVDFDAFIVETFLNYLYTDVLEINLRNFSFANKFLGVFRLNNSDESSDSDTNLHSDEDFGEEKSIRNELYTHLFIELYKISDKYCVYRLKRICEIQLVKLVTNDTLIELLILAYLYNSTKLKNKCMSHLSQNVSDIISQSSWIHLEKNYPALLAEAFRFLYFRQNDTK